MAYPPCASWNCWPSSVAPPNSPPISTTTTSASHVGPGAARRTPERPTPRCAGLSLVELVDAEAQRADQRGAIDEVACDHVRHAGLALQHAAHFHQPGPCQHRVAPLPELLPDHHVHLA